jgi:hypothetical protein
VQHCGLVGEAVAIISVSASAVVGVSGVVVAAWGGARERRWQSREERATELRAVLEDGGSQFAELMFKADEAHNEVRRHGQLSSDTKDDLEARHKSIVLAMSRVGVRRGPGALEYTTFANYRLTIYKVLTTLAEANGKGLDPEQKAAYTHAWSEALTAEKAYLDATAKALGSEGPLPRWRIVFAKLGSWRES